MTTQRVIAYHLARLKDKKAAVRLDAVQQLILLNTDDTLPALSEAYEHDNDEAVKDAMRAYLAPHFMTRLTDENANQRLDAIQWLVRLEAQEALKALETVYQTDPDAAVRKEAQKAGRTIFMNVKAKHE